MFVIDNFHFLSVSFFLFHFKWKVAMKQRQWICVSIVTVCLTCPGFGYNFLFFFFSTGPSQGIYRGIRSRFALSVPFIHWGSNTTTFGSSTNNFWLLIVHLAFTSANIVHLCTTDHLISLRDTDTNSEHLLTSQTENQFICGRGNLTVSFI
jgi:hypothetical protein